MRSFSTLTQDSSRSNSSDATTWSAVGLSTRADELAYAHMGAWISGRSLAVMAVANGPEQPHPATGTGQGQGQGRSNEAQMPENPMPLGRYLLDYETVPINEKLVAQAGSWIWIHPT